MFKQDEEIIKAQEDNSLTVNYNKWIFDNISPYVGRRVMDVGAGMGNFLPFLSDREMILAIDTMDFFIQDLNRKYSGRANVRIAKFDIQDRRVIDFAGQYNIDTVICNNVLEHVKGDQEALVNIRNIFKGEGNLVIVVPAFKLLFSDWDRSIGHFRRYTYSDIRDKLIKADFTVVSNFYMNMAGVFGWLLNGRILRNTPKKNSSVRKQAIFFDRYMVKVSRWIESKMRPPIGLSLIVIARPNQDKICAG